MNGSKIQLHLGRRWLYTQTDQAGKAYQEQLLYSFDPFINYICKKIYRTVPKGWSYESIYNCNLCMGHKIYLSRLRPYTQTDQAGKACWGQLFYLLDPLVNYICKKIYSTVPRVVSFFTIVRPWRNKLFVCIDFKTYSHLFLKHCWQTICHCD